MSNTDADSLPAPSAIFSPEDTLDELWVRAYQGEVLGEALFGRIADRLDDPEQSAKMRVLARLERKTREAIVPSLERAGISQGDEGFAAVARLAGAVERAGRAVSFAA